MGQMMSNGDKDNGDDCVSNICDGNDNDDDNDNDKSDSEKY